MAMSVAFNRANQNRKYNSNMADVPFLKSEVLITQAWFEVSYRNLVSRWTWSLLNECCYYKMLSYRRETALQGAL